MYRSARTTADFSGGRPRARHLRRRLWILCLAAITIASMACDPPAHQLDLVPTSWLISKVGSTEIPPEDRARVTFRIDEADVDLKGGSITGVLAFDTDGAALDLLGDVAVGEACGGQTTPIERSQLEALRTVRSWRVETNDRIVLQGGPEVTLERVAEE